MDKSQAKVIGIGGTAALVLYLQRKYGSAFLNDYRTIRLIRTFNSFHEHCVNNNLMVVDLFLQSVANHPYKPFILFHNLMYTYGEVDVESNKVANFAKNTEVLQQTDTVAFMMKNEPAFCWWFIGMRKIGVTCAFLNYNLRGTGLLHCIKISGSKVLVCGGDADLIKAVVDILPELHQLGIRVWLRRSNVEDLPAGIELIEDNVQDASASAISKSCRNQLTLTDQSYYIFTSGTTGLPKACKKDNRGAIRGSVVLDYFDLREDDVLYSPLPLYHSAAFTLSFLNAIRVGCTFATSRKFSASHFWEDVRKHNATIIQYIGEICRYLLAQPKKPDDGVYPVKVRVAFGNGLRPDIWEEFQNRFKIEKISEFYGASEGSHMFLNLDGKVGALGRISPLVKLLGAPCVIKYDVDTSKPIKGKDGKCIPVDPGETGLLVSVSDKTRPFLGYLDKKETERKILRNVFVDGDTYFNTGDLIRIDADGYVYFIDRIGDTFRWKGENVATTEVAGILDEFPGVMEANVYGVTIPGQDGRAGMAAITLSSAYESLDFKALYTYLKNKLPSYARPKFIRITNNMDLTGTFKHKKSDFVKQGFDPMIITDALYYVNNESKTYDELNAELYASVVKISSKL
ncbi:long-chain fatty acid transport protein 2-like [Antedon mediterranea]|uniref:long-chain fatty acid transport protein 2-like n=1 Tax=Antedon mediterranea TaxID=105859 RepID=UPI003AF8CE32